MVIYQFVDQSIYDQILFMVNKNKHS